MLTLLSRIWSYISECFKCCCPYKLDCYSTCCDTEIHLENENKNKTEDKEKHKDKRFKLGNLEYSNHEYTNKTETPIKEDDK